MLAIHFICRRDDEGNLMHMDYDKASRTSRSGKWDISVEDAQSLVGGWVYFHPLKASRSEFGGTILGFEPVVDASLPHSERVVLIVRGQPDGKGQRWRGKAHGMAHSSGLVEADLPHEQG